MAVKHLTGTRGADHVPGYIATQTQLFVASQTTPSLWELCMCENRDVKSILAQTTFCKYAYLTSWIVRTDRPQNWPPLNLQFCISACSLRGKVGKGDFYTLELAFESSAEDPEACRAEAINRHCDLPTFRHIRATKISNSWAWTKVFPLMSNPARDRPTNTGC